MPILATGEPTRTGELAARSRLKNASLIASDISAGMFSLMDSMVGVIMYIFEQVECMFAYCADMFNRVLNTEDPQIPPARIYPGLARRRNR